MSERAQMNTPRHFVGRAKRLCPVCDEAELERLFAECQAEALRHAAEESDKCVAVFQRITLGAQLRSKADAILSGAKKEDA